VRRRPRLVFARASGQAWWLRQQAALTWRRHRSCIDQLSLSQARARRATGMPTVCDRMALVLDAEGVVLPEMHPKKMYVRKPLLSFPYSTSCT
jgi:hypothetical protein